MAEVRGRALRAYQIVLVLAVGWLAGRLPQIADSIRESRDALQHAVAPVAPVAPVASPPEISAPDSAELVAEVAARVAQETVARLLVAGWRPAGVVESGTPPPAPREIVIRTVEAARPSFFFDLPAGKPRKEEKPASPLLAEGHPDKGSPPLAGGATVRATAGAAGDAGAYALATEGYAALRAGEKRKGVKLLQEAVAREGASPEPSRDRITQWKGDIHALSRRWTIAGYSLTRDGGGQGAATAASPVLGGGQTAFAVGYMLDPLAKRPVSLIGRMAAATGMRGGVDMETAEAAVGVRYQPFRGVAVDVERRFALGVFGRNAWSARVSGGFTKETTLLGRRLAVDAYGEGGVVGFSSPDFYAGGQLRGATPLISMGRIRLDAGAGVWGAAQQTYGKTASRLDVGPSARVHLSPWPVSAQIDYRVRAAGNAAPGSGPVFTVAGQF